MHADRIVATTRPILGSLRSRLRNLLGRIRRRRPPPDEPLHFSRLKRLGDDEWRAALAESPEQAARWVYAAAAYGHVDAQLYWAQMLLDGYGTGRDPESAFRWFGIAAESRRADALNMLGRCHERGWGTPVDYGKAAAYFREAAEKSYDWAQFNLACLMLDGKGIARDAAGAFELFMKAAAQGHVKSLHMIGRCREHGWGCPRDMAEATQWYRRSAEGGDFRGRYRYGLLLFERGATDEALHWLRLAVDEAPAGFCRDVAGELRGCPESALREIGARAAARGESG